jgi:glycine hydroxymethyltransferase
VLSGTQKSFPGPQGGVIYSDDAALMETVSSLVHPAMLSNHHLAHLPSLGVALLEMQTWGAEYADQVIENARALARTLDAEGVPVVGAKGAFTASHTVVINTLALGHNEALGQRLEDVGLIATTMRLPQVMGGEGIRLGTNEVTRRGATPVEMDLIGRLVADVLLNRQPADQVSSAVRELARGLQSYLFTWPEAS